MTRGSRTAFAQAAGIAVGLFFTVAALAQDAAGTPAPATSSSTASQASSVFKGNESFVTVVVALIFVMTVLALIWFRNSMISAKPAWSLADALSEDVATTAVDDNGPRFDANSKAMMVTQLKASSSRLIAFIGAIVSVFLFLG